MKQFQESHSRLMHLLYLGAILFLLSWILLWGRNSFYNTWIANRRKVVQLERTVTGLKAMNDSLAQEIERLKTNPEAAEKVAREKFGLIRENETKFIFVPAPEQESKKGK